MGINGKHPILDSLKSERNLGKTQMLPILVAFFQQGCIMFQEKAKKLVSMASTLTGYFFASTA